MRYSKISEKLFVKNRNKLIELLPNKALAIVCSHFQMPRNGDQFFPYRQDSDFFYLTGIEQEKSILLIEKQSNEDIKQHLFIIKPNKLLETWEGKKLSKASAIEISGISSVHFIDDWEEFLHSVIFNYEQIFIPILENPKFKPVVQSANAAMLQKLKQVYPQHGYIRLTPLITKLRLVKEPEEIELIKKAIEITKQAFKKVMETCRPNIAECALEAEVISTFISQGANGHAYNPIIASGENACFLHYDTNHDTCHDGELVLFDIGAEYANYAADLSRTIPVNGKFTNRQRELYQACLRVFKKARNILKPGTTINKINEQVDRFWEDEHIALGLYTREDTENTDENLCKKYFPHGTCHFMGLDVHDVGTKDVVLKPGMVLTCEPGIYIEKEKTGIRIENDILITETGNIDLMQEIPFEIEDIERLMGK